MKILQAAVLSALCVGYVPASHLGYVGHLGLYRAIDEERLDIAVELVKQDEALGEIGVRHVIRKDDPGLISSFVNQTNQANASTLKELWRKRSIATFEKVLEKVDFPQQALIDLGSSYEVGYHLEKFLLLLNKIVKPEDQEKTVEKAIEQLVEKYTDTSPLLDALKGKTFRSERLEHLAIQKAFMEKAKKGIAGFLPENICNHAAITPELYADALIKTAEWWKHHPMREFLLEQADRYDLETLKEKGGYAGLNAEFRDAIEEALETVEPGRVRNQDIRRVQIAKETFEELGHSGVPEMIAELIGSYIIDVPGIKKRTKVADEDFSVTSKSTKKRKNILSSRKSMKRSKRKGKKSKPFE